ncbi:MAG: LicD family protein [Rickettsiales bacterium]|jgi:lipopolysaccharide cholinephosphotransferase|nr:LicD family protein [Rickettsiales bacterium]
MMKILTWFVPSRRMRHKMRAALKNKNIGRKLDNIKNILSVRTDFSKIPQPHGYMELCQQANLKMLFAFDKLCKQNGIDYFMNAGDVIGMIRHGRPIPWDYDSDCGVAGADWKKTLSLLRRILPNKHFGIVYVANFLKICYGGAGIDIFKYSHFSRDIDWTVDVKMIGAREKKFCNKLKRRPMIIIRADESVEEIDRKWNLIEKYDSELDRLFDKYVLLVEPQDDCGAVIYAGGSSEIFEYGTVFPTRRLNYGGTELSFPNNVGDYAMMLYGDIWQFPNDVLTHPGISASAIEYFKMKKAFENISGVDLYEMLSVPRLLSKNMVQDKFRQETF